MAAKGSGDIFSSCIPYFIFIIMEIVIFTRHGQTLLAFLVNVFADDGWCLAASPAFPGVFFLPAYFSRPVLRKY